MLQAKVYREMWESSMDEALEKLLQISSDGTYLVGSLQVPKNYRAKATYVAKVGLL